MKFDVTAIQNAILPPSAAAAQAVKQHWDSIAKPLNGLGRLETLVERIGALTGDPSVSLGRRAVVVLCADNGVVAEGVTQTDASVTATMAAQIACGQSSVCRMAATAGADVLPFDMGMLHRVKGVSGCHIANGTKNFVREPAMTAAQAEAAISYGIELTQQLKQKGYGLLMTGEMGIGNTTTAAALASALLGLPPSMTVGRGAGLSDEGLRRKQAAVARALELHRPDPQKPLEALAALGGFDIAGMVGLFIGGAIYRVPVVVDGLISAVAALAASRLCPACRCAMLPSHASAEPASLRILQELQLAPVLHADLRLGEGTGAVCLLPLLDMALSVYHSSATFCGTGIVPYEQPEDGSL